MHNHTSHTQKHACTQASLKLQIPYTMTIARSCNLYVVPNNTTYVCKYSRNAVHMSDILSHLNSYPHVYLNELVTTWPLAVIIVIEAMVW